MNYIDVKQKKKTKLSVVRIWFFKMLNISKRQYTFCGSYQTIEKTMLLLRIVEEKGCDPKPYPFHCLNI